MGAERSTEIAELAVALSAAQAEFTSIPKDSTNPFFKSSYAGLPAVVKVASPILSKHGLSVSQFLGVNEAGDDTLTTWLLHASGQFIAESMRLYLTKKDAQSQGSATTYARRYAYMAVLGLVADDDDDGNAARSSSSTENGGARVSAAPVQQTERVATAKQRGLISAKAGEKGLPPITLANIVNAAGEGEPIDFESQSNAENWLRRALDRLPARLVDPILDGIKNAETEQSK